MPELETFRSDTRAWLLENCPPSLVGMPMSELDGTWGGKRWEFKDPNMKTWLEVMGKKGWTAPTWPSEYGGGGLTSVRTRLGCPEYLSPRCYPIL